MISWNHFISVSYTHLAGCYKESGKARRSFGKELAEHGFDIRVEAGRLEEMYVGMM